jgi:hypothetical protein
MCLGTYVKGQWSVRWPRELIIIQYYTLCTSWPLGLSKLLTIKPATCKNVILVCRAWCWAWRPAQDGFPRDRARAIGNIDGALVHCATEAQHTTTTFTQINPASPQACLISRTLTRYIATSTTAMALFKKFKHTGLRWVGAPSSSDF